MRAPRPGKSVASVRTVWIVVILAIAFEVALVLVFGITQHFGMEDRADEALDCLLRTGEYPNTSDVPEVYVVYDDEVLDNMLFGASVELGAYVYDHLAELPANKTLSFGEGHNVLFYRLARGTAIDQDEEYHPLLAYCDVSYAYNVMQRTIVVMATLAAVMAGALIFAGRAAARAIKRRDETQRAFFANASHELKTPLMTIQGNACGMRDGYVAMDEGCEAIDSAAERMSSLVGDILDLSRVDAGVAVPQSEACDVREIVYDALSAIELEASKRGIELQVDLPAPLPRQCDEQMTYTIISNVVSNGVRHAASRLSVSAGEDANGRVSVLVVNDGTPISDEDAAHAFDRFYCGEQGQTGIGLSLAQEYANLQGGVLSARPLPDGTEFAIVLP